jgi:hypothetical protein
MMVNWQITAATLRCDLVHDEVTVLVYKDWSVKCTGHQKYASTKSKKRTGNPVCEGPDCRMAQDYLKKLKEEEAK